MKSTLTGILLGIATMVMIVPPQAFAQDEDAGQAQSNLTVPVARQLFSEGVQAARQRRWKTAFDRFSRSYELAPRLLTLFNLAAAQRNTGRLVEASESYRRFLRDTRDGRYPEYRADAIQAIEDLEGRISYVRLKIRGLHPDDELMLDRKTFPQAGVSEPIPMNAGSHEVVVRRSGKSVARRSFQLRESGSATVEIEVRSPPTKLAAGPRRADWITGEAPRHDDKHAGGSLLGSPWFWAAVAVVVGGGVGGYLLVRDRAGEPTEGTLGRGVISF